MRDAIFVQEDPFHDFHRSVMEMGSSGLLISRIAEDSSTSGSPWNGFSCTKIASRIPKRSIMVMDRQASHGNT